ncbi:MAG: hypothetical protein ACI9R3_002384, partial [Verrucomicrobiales bacterium]
MLRHADAPSTEVIVGLIATLPGASVARAYGADMNTRLLLIVTLLTGSGLGPACGQESAHPGPACFSKASDFFRDEMWPKVAAGSCLKCHKAGGDAE